MVSSIVNCAKFGYRGDCPPRLFRFPSCETYLGSSRHDALTVTAQRERTLNGSVSPHTAEAMLNISREKGTLPRSILPASVISRMTPRCTRGITSNERGRSETLQL